MLHIWHDEIFCHIIVTLILSLRMLWSNQVLVYKHYCPWALPAESEKCLVGRLEAKAIYVLRNSWYTYILVRHLESAFLWSGSWQLFEQWSITTVKNSVINKRDCTRARIYIFYVWHQNPIIIFHERNEKWHILITFRISLFY